MRSGRKSYAVRGGGIRSRFDLAKDSFESSGAAVVSMLSWWDPSGVYLYPGGKSIWTTFSATESMTGIKS